MCFAETNYYQRYSEFCCFFWIRRFSSGGQALFYFHLEQLHSVANVALNNNNNTINVTTTKQMLQVNATSETTDPGNDTDSSDPLRQLSQRAAKG